jgi:uncharacterized protein YcfJ
MNSKMLLTTIVVAASLSLSSGVFAYERGDHRGYDRYDRGYDSRPVVSHDSRRHPRKRQGRVLKVKPIIKTVSVPVTKERCRSRHGNNNAGATLVGAVIGGIVGNQFGHGDGKVAMTIIGSVTGAAVGHEAGKGRHGKGRCSTSTRYVERDKVVGYRVKYRYHGDTYWTRTKTHPGKYIEVNGRGEGRRYARNF